MIDYYKCSSAKITNFGGERSAFCEQEACSFGYQHTILSEKGQVTTCQTGGVVPFDKVLEKIIFTPEERKGKILSNL